MPSPALKAPGRRSRLLFHWAARDLSLVPRTGQVPTFTRASAGGAVADRQGRFWTPVHSQPRFDGVDTGGDGVADEYGLLLEYARTNLCLWSSDFSNVQWSGGSDFTLSAATSIITGQVARRHLNNNLVSNRSRTQILGTLQATGDVLYAIVENIDADTTAIGVRDDTAGTWAHLIVFTWATRTAATSAGSGSFYTKRLAEIGPNGGPVYLIAVAGFGTVGNSRRYYVYPTGTSQNGKTVVMHHGQLESGRIDPSSPIVTTTTSVARVADRLTYPLNLAQITAGRDAFTLYARFARPFHADATGTITDFPGILSLGCVVPYVQLYFSASSRVIGAELKDATPTTTNVAASVPAGGVLEVSVQVKDLATEPAIALDVGSGLGAFATNNLLPIGAFGSKIGVGEINDGVHELQGMLLQAKVAAGLRSLTDMRESL